MKNYYPNTLSASFIKRLCVFISTMFLQFGLAGQTLDIEQFEELGQIHAFTGATAFDNNLVSVFRTAVVEPVEILGDPTGTLDIEDITGKEHDGKWVDYKELKSEPHQVYWLRTTIIGNEDFRGEQFFHISEIQGLLGCNFGYIDSYSINQDDSVRVQRTGDLVPPEVRIYDSWASYIVIDIQPGDTIRLYSRLADMHPFYLVNQIALWHIDKEDLFSNQAKQAAKNGLFFGILGIQMIFFLLLYLIERELIHLYYALFVFSLFAIRAFAIQNYYFYVPLPYWVNCHEPLYYISMFSAEFTGFLFLIKFFKYPKSIFTHKVIPFILFLCGLSTAIFIFRLQLFGSEYHPPIASPGHYTFLALLASLYLIVTAKSAFKHAKLLVFFAFFPVILVALITIIGDILVYEHSWLYRDDLLKISVIILITILAIIVGYRNNQLKADKAVAEQKNIFDQKEKENAERIKLSAQQLEKTNGLLEIQNAKNEVLLKEIHHRVKNNLQTISSLLSLQSNSIEDQSALDAVQESQNRVASMALIHQKLYQGENLAAIEMRDYFETIGKEILNSFGEKAIGVELDVDMSEIELDVDSAIPIGLITNELITNSLKYAFKEKGGGKISIAMNKDENNLIQLIIADNGRHELIEISEGGTGFGSMLINLLTIQLGGQLEQTSEQGTATIIKFPLNKKTA